MDMSARSVELRIERLVLPPMPAGEVAGLGREIERELAERLAGADRPPVAHDPAPVSLAAGEVELSGVPDARTVGACVAATILDAAGGDR